MIDAKRCFVHPDIQARMDDEARFDNAQFDYFTATHGGKTPTEVLAEQDPIYAEMLARRRK